MNTQSKPNVEHKVSCCLLSVQTKPSQLINTFTPLHFNCLNCSNLYTVCTRMRYVRLTMCYLACCNKFSWYERKRFFLNIFKRVLFQ